jgi:hypothetical protein
MAANQSISDEAPTNGGVEVVKKVNINFGSLKLNDSKKRLRPPTTNASQGGPQVSSGISGQTSNYDMQGAANGGGLSSESSQMSDGMPMSVTTEDEGNDYTRKLYKPKRLKPQQQ